MVIFLTSKIGFEEMKNTIISQKWSVWVGSSVLSENHVTKYRKQGIDLTVFNKDFAEDDIEKIEDALYTIQEHHPDEHILVERVVKNN